MSDLSSVVAFWKKSIDLLEKVYILYKPRVLSTIFASVLTALRPNKFYLNTVLVLFGIYFAGTNKFYSYYVMLTLKEMKQYEEKFSCTDL